MLRLMPCLYASLGLVGLTLSLTACSKNAKPSAPRVPPISPADVTSLTGIAIPDDAANLRAAGESDGPLGIREV